MGFNPLSALKLFKGYRRELFCALCLILSVGLIYSREINDRTDIFFAIMPMLAFVVYLVFECVGYYFMLQMKQLDVRKIEATKGQSARNTVARSARRRQKK